MPTTSTKAAMLTAPGSIAGDALPREPGEVMAKPDVDVLPRASRMDQIARRAHEIYEARGGNHGKVLEDWLQAEREVDDAVRE